MSKARFFVLAQFSLLGVLVLLPVDDAVNAPNWFRAVSLALMISSFAILLFAAIALRPALTASPVPRAGAPLVRSGIYKYVRHPMYTAVIAIGAAIMLGNPTFLTMVVWVALIIVLLNKAHFEDTLLLAKHPAAKDYQLTIGAFLPKLKKSN